MKKTILFIINPISGIGKQKTVEELALKHFNKNDFDITFKYTQRAKHALEISSNAAGKFDIVVAVGGDGTVNEVANGLVNSTTSLAIIPTGSGNGFARFLKIPLTPERAILFIKKATSQKIDCIKFQDRYFVNVAGIGFDADISHRFANYGTRGFRSYLQIIAEHIQNYKVKEFSLEVENSIITQKAFLISFANTSTWGNNAHIAPLAQVDDGILDIAVLEKFPVLTMPALAARLFGKTLHKSKFLKIIRCKSVIIKNNSTLLAHIDGEPVSYQGDVKLEVVEKCLNVVAKKASNRGRLEALTEQLKLGH